MRHLLKSVTSMIMTFLTAFVVWVSVMLLITTLTHAEPPNEYIQRIRRDEIIIEYVENDEGKTCYIVKYKDAESSPICPRESMLIENNVNKSWI